MDTIRAYLDSMFTAFPSTPEVERAYEDLLGAMEDKYNELKAGGKSEQETIGTVISEFGNIDELMEELGLERETGADGDSVGADIALEYLAAKTASAKLMALGTLLCILGVAALCVISYISSSLFVFGVVALFALVAGGVACFLLGHGMVEAYDYLRGEFVLSTGAERAVRQEKRDFGGQKTICTVAGVILLIFALLVAVLLIFANLDDGLVFQLNGVRMSGSALIIPSAFLPLVALGTAPLVYMGVIGNAYNVILQEGDYSPKNKRVEKVIGAVASVWFPVCVVIYLAWSFISGSWGTSWLIWPISGILFGAFAGVYSILCGEGQI